MELTSAQNPLLKEIRRALGTGKPLANGLVALEGPHLLEEALRSGMRPRYVVTTEEGSRRYESLLSQTAVSPLVVGERLFERISSLDNAQPVVTLVSPRSWSWAELLQRPALLLALDAIQDPGNAGAMVRSAEAFGATGVVFLRSCVRFSHPKYLRASAGSAFRVPAREDVTVDDFLAQARSAGLVLYALAAGGGRFLEEAAWHRPCALVVGNEGSGVGAELRDACVSISIRTRTVESLNAGVACSIALYEAHNQRIRHEPL